MKKTALSIGIAAAFMMGGSSVMAGQISGLTDFASNTTAKASEVNENFAAVKTAVNDNDTRITANKSAIGDANSGLVKGVADNKAAIGDENSGLVKDVAANKTAIGDANSGLVKDVATNATAIGDASSGLVKGVADNKAAIAANATAIDGKAAASGSGNSIDENASDIGSLQTGVNDLKTVVGDSNSGLVKDVADLKAGGSCPNDMAVVGSICFDKTEYQENGVAKVNVSQKDAQKLCLLEGKYLPTNAEWSMAVMAMVAAAEKGEDLGIVNMDDGVYEWVADWTGDGQGLLRGDRTAGGGFGLGTGSEVYIPWTFVDNGNGQGPNNVIGFRCAK